MNNSPFTFISEKIINSIEWVDFKETVEWCQDNIYLSSEASPYTGMISFERTPWIEEILKDWDKKWIEEYDIMASTQVGKTTIEFCCIAKELDTDPTMMQLTIPIADGVSEYVTTKFEPFFKGIKSLQKKMLERKDEEKNRFKGSLKEVPGGKLFILGNTANNRRSKTVKNIFLDEVALFGKGHVAELRGRTKFFEKTGRKIFLVSSRKHKGDEMELAYDASYCKKELQILCKGCGEFFYPESKHFKYLTPKEYKEKNNIQKIENITEYKRVAKNTGNVVCECGHKTSSRDIEDLVREKNVKLVIVEGQDEDSRHGYKLNALATALTNYSTIVEELIDAGVHVCIAAGNTSQKIDVEIRRIIDAAIARATTLLVDNRDKLEAIAEGLLKYEVLDGAEIDALIKGEPIRTNTQTEEQDAEAQSTKQAAEEQPAEEQSNIDAPADGDETDDTVNG